MADQLAKMDSQLDKLTSLISDLLDITKIESGQLQFRQEQFDFNQLVKDIVEETQQVADRHQIELQLAPTNSIQGDRDRIGQAISNLLTNAVKYSPNAYQITVSTQVTKDAITLCVKDSGIGIPPEKLQRVFERFYRVEDREHHHTYAGLGLGLYISAEIINRHGGEIWVESEIGKGSAFSFSLPLK